MPQKPTFLYHSLITQWKLEFFGGRKFFFQKQYLERYKKTLVYHYVNKDGGHSYQYDDSVMLERSMLDDHFLQDKHLVATNWYGGSLAVRPCFDNEWLRWVCFDLDEEDSVTKFMDKVSPRLQELGIQYLEELGGDNDERRHIWIKMDCPHSDAKKFFTRLFMEIFQTTDDPFIQEGFTEVFGVNKIGNIIRVPLGYHLRRDKRSPIICQDGTLTTDPGKFFQEWIALKPLTSEDLNALGGRINAPEIKEKKIAEGDVNKAIAKGKFNYIPRNLPVNMPDVPSKIMPAYKNCQAIHDIIDEVQTENLIAKRGELHHSAGLYLSGIAAYADGMSSKGRKKSTEGLEWFKSLVSNYRKRDNAETHNWDYKYKDAQFNPSRYFPRCTTWEEKFDKCNGCPYKGRINSPTQFIYGTQIKPVRTGEFISLVTPDQVRQTTFLDVRARINSLLTSGEWGNLLLASNQGTGKSHLVDKIACDLAKGGYKVLIACPTVKLSKEHKERIEACGEHAFILASHNGIFKEELVNFDCPSSQEITDALDLGVQRKIIKNNFCQSCPFRDQCYFPNQYKEVMEDKHKIVLIQHAHMSSPEIMYEIMKKQFDVLIVDETFINIVFTELPINQKEKTLLDNLDYTWSTALYDWLDGAIPRRALIPDEYELDKARKVLQVAGVPWRVPELIRLYNSKRKVDVERNVIQAIYELPDIPIKLFTDATPPLELMKELTGLEDIEVFGKDEILDIKAIHPDNKIIQIINNSTSVTSLSEEIKFEAIVLKILDLAECHYTTNEKILVTLYKSDIERFKSVYEKYKDDFPTAMDRITLDWMSKGTNKYEDYDVQFLLCGLYPSGGDLRKAAYNYKEVANFYRQRRGGDELKNISSEVPKLCGFSQLVTPVTRYEYTSDGRGEKIEYEGVEIKQPEDLWHSWIYQLNVANTQQSLRLRFKPDKKREIYILNNFFYPNLIISESMLLEDFVVIR